MAVVMLAVMLSLSLATTATASAQGTNTGVVYYTVRPGDWVSRIAARCGVSAQSIINANHLRYPYYVYVPSSHSICNQM